jgi:hypothetical protein
MSTNDSSTNPHIEASQQAARTMIEQIQSIARGNQRHLNRAAAASTTMNAQATFATAFIYGTLSIGNASSQGYSISFYGTMWGIGFGGGTTWGALTFTVPLSELNGMECSFQVTTAPSLVTIQFWNDQYGYVANFSGGGLSIGAGITGGKGTWKTTTP